MVVDDEKVVKMTGTWSGSSEHGRDANSAKMQLRRKILHRDWQPLLNFTQRKKIDRTDVWSAHDRSAIGKDCSEICPNKLSLSSPSLENFLWSLKSSALIGGSFSYVIMGHFCSWGLVEHLQDEPKPEKKVNGSSWYRTQSWQYLWGSKVEASENNFQTCLKVQQWILIFRPKLLARVVGIWKQNMLRWRFLEVGEFDFSSRELGSNWKQGWSLLVQLEHARLVNPPYES